MSPSVAVSAAPAHPRSRGENLTVEVLVAQPVGSSPLTRGKRSARRTRSPGRRAHPRSRGENPDSRLRGGFRFGSSPLTRGKLRGEGPGASAVGLIPAHAGKTDPLVGRRDMLAAHPRSRGENGHVRDGRGGHFGSSPLTRGKRRGWSDVSGRNRLIPAHAGKTPPHRPTGPRSSAHPRSRGENRHRLLRGRWH